MAAARKPVQPLHIGTLPMYKRLYRLVNIIDPRQMDEPVLGWLRTGLSVLEAVRGEKMTSFFRGVATTNLPVRYRYRDGLKYGVYAAQPGLVRECALESARVAIVRKTRTKQLYMIKAHVPITKKPLGSRMGKGKGKVDHYVANVKAGKIIFEFNCDSEAQATEAFRQATNRLPIKTHFRVKPAEKKEIWTQF